MSSSDGLSSSLDGPQCTRFLVAVGFYSSHSHALSKSLSRLQESRKSLLSLRGLPAALRSVWFREQLQRVPLATKPWIHSKLFVLYRSRCKRLQRYVAFIDSKDSEALPESVFELFESTLRPIARLFALFFTG